MRMMECNLANRLAHAALASAILLAVGGMRGALAADPATAPAVYAGWPFDAVEAQRRQQETAERLGVPAEVDLDLGNGVTMKLALIPAGRFVMGSPEDEAGRWSHEGPQREVTISRPFYMGVHEVTRGQFAAFVRASGSRTDAEKEGWADALIGLSVERVDGASWRNPGFEQTDAHPVVCVSHNDAVAFCQWLSTQSSRAVRLPTEARWEYACRAGTTTRFHFGDDDSQLQQYGWYGAWFGGHSRGPTHPVGQKRPNAFGLYDMHGNVWESCQDWYADSYSNEGLVDPSGPASGSYRVLRGGSWLISPPYCRSACRGRSAPEYRTFNFGFRIAVDLK